MKRIANARSKLTCGRRASAVFVLCATTATVLSAQTFVTLYSFCCGNGEYPFAGLVQATNGDLYGTTENGGLAPGSGAGTVFKITPGGTLTTLHSFCSESGCADGGDPAQGLVQATNGDFYGTTGAGGANNSGTVFKITPGGTLTTLHSFCSESGCADGGDPAYGALVQATHGNLYGTTALGGVASSSCKDNGCGTVFKITPTGTLTTLYSFCSQTNCTDGAAPYGGLVQATNGDLYGTTTSDGANGVGGGTVFKITPSGTLTTLYSFCSQIGCTDGAAPYGGLIQATNGDFYGTTAAGGASDYGTVFKISPNGTLTTLHSFFDTTDGAYPTAGLVQGTSGNFYGTAFEFGANGYGTVFEITPRGTLTALHSFAGTDGGNPIGVLVRDTNGNLYGTTTGGGANGGGTVFRLSVGLGPFVETQTASGEVGAAVKILGSDLTGATSVTFNGIAAAFEVVSGSEITTTVPTGATTGTVEVVTSTGTTLSSNVPFRVP